MRNIFTIALFVLIFFGSVNAVDSDREMIIKSVFIEKFTRFIDWPADSDFDDESVPFRIGVFESESFYKALRQSYSRQKIKGKSVEIKYLKSNRDCEKCDLVFIGDVEDNKLKDLLSFLEGRPALTISDRAGFADKGVMINFVEFEGKVRFEINEEAAKKSNFRFSYHLLKLSR